MSKINNQSSLTSKYVLPDQSSQSFETQSNVLSTEILLQKPDVVIEKSANRNYVVKNDTIGFTNKITNKGDIPVQEVVFKDILPSDVEFVAGSVLIDQEENLDANPLVGINLKDLQPGDSTEVKFSVLVK